MLSSLLLKIPPPSTLLYKNPNQFPKLGKRFYSTSSRPTSPLHPWYVTGLSDGESSFIVSIYQRGNSWTVRCSYELWLHTLDLPLLHKLQAFFQVGSVNLRQYRPIASFAVTRIDDLLSVIVPHFTNYPLQTQKHSDFLLWAKVVELVQSGSHLTKSGLLEIVALASAINRGISDKLQAAFPDVTPHENHCLNLAFLDYLLFVALRMPKVALISR